MSGERWRLLPYDLGPSERHFALSDALARCVETPTVWWHSADAPTLILGPGQRFGLENADSCRASGVSVVRRQAGGTAVFASLDVLGMDIALPAGHRFALSDIVEAYRWVGLSWQHAMEQLGIATRLVTVDESRDAARARGPNHELVTMACFGGISPYEVMVEGRKLVGLAQVRRRAGVLFQSGIHLRFDADTLAGLLAGDREEQLARALRAAGVGLQELRAGTGFEQVMAAFHRALSDLYDVTLESGAWTDREVHHADNLAQVKS